MGLGEVTVGKRAWVGTVLDLTTPGFISSELPPVGYYAMPRPVIPPSWRGPWRRSPSW